MAKKKKYGDKWIPTGETIGQGGQAQILEVLNEKDNSKYALKKLTNIRRKERLDLEISVSKSAFRQGCKVLEIIDDYIPYESESEKPWYIMPISTPFDKRLFEEKVYEGNLSLALSDFVIIAEAVLDLHSKGITHRDLKPDNLFYENGDFLLGDLGLCLPLYEMEEEERLSGELERIGSIHYTPIEAFHKNPIDENQKAYDIYALGKILYLMISGRILPGFNNPLDTEYNLISVYNSPTIHSVNLLLKKLLHNDPKQRLDVATILIDRLKQIIDEGELVSSEDDFADFQLELIEASSTMAQKVVNQTSPTIQTKESSNEIETIKNSLCSQIKENQYFLELKKHFEEYYADEIDFSFNENDNALKGNLIGPFVKSRKALEPLEDIGNRKEVIMKKGLA